jgi:hypothetical protein
MTCSCEDSEQVAMGRLAGVSAVSSWMPTRVVVSAWLEHAPFASWVMSAVRPRVFVELGTHNGFSFFTMCEAAARLGIETHAYAVDTWRGDDHTGFYDDSIFVDVSQYSKAHYADTSTLLRGYFDDFVASFADGSIDLLHIDGRHGYDDVRHDFEVWLPKLSRSGVVLFHDISEREDGFEVWKFWAEVKKQYSSFEFEHGHGLGVLAVGPEPASAVKDLIAIDAIDAANVRDFYASMGQQTLATFDGELRDARNKNEIANLTSALDASNGLITEIVSSYSWKLTQPLRRCISLLSTAQRSRIRKMISKGDATVSEKESA